MFSPPSAVKHKITAEAINMRIHTNASIDRLMTRRAEKNLKSGAFDNYLTGFLNNRNYNYGFGGIFNNFNNFNNSSSNSFDPYNVMNSTGFNFSYDTIRNIRNDLIEKAVKSGEPMRGVSYNDYLVYYMEKNGSVDTRTMQFYKQDLKGDNAALRDKQWRTDPAYIIPERLYKNSEILADKEAALDKLARNEKLEDWEQRLLDTLKK